MNGDEKKIYSYVVYFAMKILSLFIFNAKISK
jgi:hypothetical protein